MENIFLRILNMNVTASYVILVAIILRLLLKKAPKIFSYVLWSAVFFRLVCPFSFESVLSLIRINSLVAPERIMAGQLTQISSQIGTIDRVANHAAVTPALGVSTTPMDIWVTIGKYVWLIGICALLLYSIYTAIRLHNKVKSSIRICENEYENVYQMGGIKTPFVFGFLRPKIYLPENLTEKERVYIIKHEQTHIRRFDHIIKPLGFLILCIHWFNPLVWLAFFLMSEDMELSCDESVIRQLGNGVKKDYSSSLLSLSTGKKIIGGCPLAFGESNTKGRIKNILNYKKPTFWIIAVSILAVAAVGIGLITNPPEEKMTEIDYAEQFVENQIAALGDAKWADFSSVESEIIKFERLDRFDDILNAPVEIWHIEYRFKPGDIDDAALGNVNYVDGWLVEDDTMGFKALVFSYEKSKPKYLGSIFSIDGLNGNGDTVSGRETLLRVYLEQQGLLPYETYRGDHVIVKFPLSTGETSQLFLSQPAKNGNDGIWCVERWMDGNGSVYYDIPKTEGRIVEYYLSLQQECDEGHKPYLLDPIQVAIEYINGEGGLGQRVSTDELEIIRDAKSEDFLETPESHYIGFIGNFTINGTAKPYFHLDQIEWLTLDDEARLKELNIDPDDLPNGFYIYNPASYPMYHQCNDETEFSIIDFGETYKEGEYMSHKSVNATGFAEYLKQFHDFTPPFHVYTKDGYVKAIVEQYVP